MKQEGTWTDLIEQLSENITSSDFKTVRDACKDDRILEADLEALSSPKELLEFLCDNHLLCSDDPSFIEHVFELCRRPDLLAVVMNYRLSNIGLDGETCIGKKLTRVKSAGKYADTSQVDENKPALVDESKPTLKLSAPPKSRRRITSTN